jgi:hypothetical protein
MAASILWAAGIALESLILLRFLKCRLFRHFPLFFAYMALVWSSTLILLPLYRSSAYANAYWALEFLALLAGFGVLLELIQKSFEGYAGAKRFSTAVLTAMFAVLFAYCIYKVAIAPPGTVYENFSDLERDFRAVQALALTGFLVVIAYYRIDVGKNLKGIVCGFGLFVGSIVLSNALRGYAGPSFNAAWNVIQPYTYFVALLIWVVALWSYAPAPAPDRTIESGGDYEIFARETKKRLGVIRAEVGRAERQ